MSQFSYFFSSLLALSLSLSLFLIYFIFLNNSIEIILNIFKFHDFIEVSVF